MIFHAKVGKGGIRRNLTPKEATVELPQLLRSTLHLFLKQLENNMSQVINVKTFLPVVSPLINTIEHIILKQLNC